MFASPNKVRRIGVFKFRNIGDVLMITPSLRALRETFPDARIVVGVNSVTDAMLENNPHIDEVLVYDRARQRPWARMIYDLRFFQRIRRERFDLTIDFTSGDRAAGYSLLSGARTRLAFHNYRWKKWGWQNLAYTQAEPLPLEPMHEVERHLWLLGRAGIRTSDNSLCLRPTDENKRWAAEIIAPYRLKPIVHVHPVARWLYKCWNNEKMAAAIDWLELERGAKVMVTSSADTREMERANAILALCQSQPHQLIGKISLGQMIALTELTDCFLGVDTAPMHIAAAMGTPVVALFGPTSNVSWRPWCEHQVTLKKSCPCMEHGKSVCQHDQVRQCMDAISVEEVKSALDHFLRARPVARSENII